MPSSVDNLFASTALGAISLSNRIVMAPMTRDRAAPGDVPDDLVATYYRQRASAGLIVTEGVQPSPDGKGYWRTPGIYTDAQIEGWRRVAADVHARGGRIVMQIMHCGRAALPDNREYAADIIAPSAIACRTSIPGPDGAPQPPPLPRALDLEEIPAVIAAFARAALNARNAGLDGVELHCASGYLPNQFLNASSNQRTDGYGGSAQARARFALETLSAMADAIGADRVGFRISPGNSYNDMEEPDLLGAFTPLLRGADALGLAYLHVVDVAPPGFDVLGFIRSNWRGAVIANNNLTPDRASALITDGVAQAVSFGRGFIANPDLVDRIKTGAQWARVDRATLYTGAARGYTDYPKANGEAA